MEIQYIATFDKPIIEGETQAIGNMTLDPAVTGEFRSMSEASFLFRFFQAWHTNGWTDDLQYMVKLSICANATKEECPSWLIENNGKFYFAVTADVEESL